SATIGHRIRQSGCGSKRGDSLVSRVLPLLSRTPPHGRELAPSSVWPRSLSFGIARRRLDGLDGALRLSQVYFDDSAASTIGLSWRTTSSQLVWASLQRPAR